MIKQVVFFTFLFLCLYRQQTIAFQIQKIARPAISTAYCQGGQETVPSPDQSNACTYKWESAEVGGKRVRGTVLSSSVPGAHLEVWCASQDKWNFDYNCPNKTGATCPGGMRTDVKSADNTNTCAFAWLAASAGSKAVFLLSTNGTASGSCQENGTWNVSVNCPSAPPKTPNYTYDETLQNWTGMFVAYNPSQPDITHLQINPVTGMTGGMPFPERWQNLNPGESVRLRILIPPGVSYASANVESPSNVANAQTCLMDGVTCTAKRGAGDTPIWPLNANHGFPPLTTPTVVSYVVETESVFFTFFKQAISFHIADGVLYENWRKERSWAGGSGDCDGLGNTFCGTPRATHEQAKPHISH